MLKYSACVLRKGGCNVTKIYAFKMCNNEVIIKTIKT